jgi:uncharacterized membrane protein
MAFCSKCGTQVPEGAAACPNCGTAQGSSAPAASKGGLESNIAAALAYVWLLAILWLLMEPYNKDRFVRFHSFQALAFGVIWFVLTSILGMIPILGWLLLIFVVPAGLVLWLICIFKAFSNQWFKLPLVGDWAMGQAGPAQ